MRLRDAGGAAGGSGLLYILRLWDARFLFPLLTRAAIPSTLIVAAGGSNSVVEFLPSKQAVAGSNPVSRSIILFLPDSSREDSSPMRSARVRAVRLGGGFPAARVSGASECSLTICWQSRSARR